MPRLVVPRSATSGNLAAASVEDQPADDYSSRLVKYIPAESVAFFACVDKLIASHFGIGNTASTTAATSSGAFALSLIVFLLGLVGTPLYLWRRRLPRQPWMLNAGIATIAFVLWAYTLGGSLFLLLGWYQVFLAGLFAPIFTFVAGFFEPAPPKAPQA
ncbi:hypothetical protein [Enterovirga aerilata]|uniref:Uncharacterized protein n=1 Tax=Enterovirga aerilata TaxID=2730920 RepID=A0A849I408_9HYPH|nr:hypothetical protein [Enterovirga sp. DB1703]NNM72071.1 hypothetical protein [Enterovirga sp. DB1703]